MDLYLHGAFGLMSEKFSKITGLSAPYCYHKLQELVDQHGLLHDTLFNFWLEQLGIFSRENLQLAINTFHEYPANDIRLWPDTMEVLAYLSEKYKLGIITDGRASTQQRKIEKLGISHYFESILLTDKLNVSKPDLFCFKEASMKIGVPLRESLFVGDHPEKDIYGGRHAGMYTARIMKGAYSKLHDTHAYGPHIKINDLKKLLEYL